MHPRFTISNQPAHAALARLAQNILVSLRHQSPFRAELVDHEMVLLLIDPAEVTPRMQTTAGAFKSAARGGSREEGVADMANALALSLGALLSTNPDQVDPIMNLVTLYVIRPALELRFPNNVQTLLRKTKELM